MKTDVAIITALQIELDAVKELGQVHYGLRWRKIPSKRSSNSYYYTTNGLGTRIILAKTSSMGQVRAAAITGDLLAECFPQVILLVGIAAGIGDAVHLGDIAISKRFIDYEVGKVTDEGSMLDYPIYNSSNSLISALENISNKEFHKKCRQIRPDSGATNIHVGDIFCGNKVVADSNISKDLKATFRKAIALEMESVGVAAALEDKKTRPHFAMIKGICDKADSKKDDSWQLYAAEVSAAYALAFLSENNLNEFILDSHLSIEDRIDTILNIMAPSAKNIKTYQRELIDTILRSSLKEVNDITSGHYSINMAPGGHYLPRAAPLFGNASRLFATSLDTVSTFWTDTNNRSQTQEYLRHQAPRGVAMRLFVFSSADTAHKYAKMLDKHTESYKNVFICSKSAYRKILKELSLGETIDQLFNCDFSILEYEYGSKDNTYIYAKLSSSSLQYDEINIDQSGEIDYRRFMELLEQFSRTKQGTIDKQYGVLHWEQGAWQDREKWSKVLVGMFNVRDADVYHILTFNTNKIKREDIRLHCANVKQAIMNSDDDEKSQIKTKYGIKEMWYGKKVKYGRILHDGKYLGDLQMDDSIEDQYTLIMKFDTTEGLMGFYEDGQHSIIRKKLYENLDDRIPKIYDLMTHFSSSRNDEQNTKMLYESIESIASHHMKRKDYVDDELILEMIRAVEPYSF